MKKWSNNYLNLLGSESYDRFIEFHNDPNKLESNEELRHALLDFIADFADWDNSTSEEYLETSRALTQAAHESLGGAPQSKPLVVDPFTGGGSIPLEALRVGADAYASDLNPIPVLLNKVILEYIPKHGQDLADQVRKWADWMNNELRNELSQFYPEDTDGATPIAYIWARTIISEAPGGSKTAVEVPLLSSMWLANKSERRQAFRWVRDKHGTVKTNIVEKTYADGRSLRIAVPVLEIFSPSSAEQIEPGTSRGGAATCPVTGFTTSVESVRRQLDGRSGGASDARLLAVVTTNPTIAGRHYRSPCEKDIEAVRGASDEFRAQTLAHKGSEAFVPNGQLNHLRGFFNVVLYGMKRWGDLFAPRQALAMVTLARLVRDLRIKLIEVYGVEFASAIQTCLAIGVDRQADSLSSLTRWQPSRETGSNTFGRQALPMVWDYVEPVPISHSAGSFGNAVDWIISVIEGNLCVQGNGQSEMASATKHPLPDDIADAIFTDPPYYSAIPYADLSDFFYSWLRKSLQEAHQSLFASDLSPKEDECVSLSHRAAMYRHKNSAWFEEMMTRACAEARRIDKPTGIGVFVFANKETSGWEAMLGALVSSGWIVTASWPIDTEMGSRLRARNSATLASSVHLVCRPRKAEKESSEDETVGDWREVLQELPRRIHEWMPRLANEGVVGADAIFACLGPALEVFSKYSRVEKANGEAVTLKEYLVFVWAAVAKEALAMVFKGADASGFEEDARLTAIWLWTLFAGQSRDNGFEDNPDGDEEAEETGSKQKGYVLEYDAARKIAQGLGAHLESLPSLVEIKGETATLLSVAERTRRLFSKDESESPIKIRKKKKPQLQLGFIAELEQAEEIGSWGSKGAPSRGATVLDRVHQSMILFAAGRGEALRRFLVDESVGRDERFWRLAQVLSFLYPKTSDEKRWIDGVLARKKGLGF
jgi:adenine-specific DNA methylase